MTIYQIVVYTGSEENSGTDANVYITLFGENGNSDERELDNPENNFEKGRADTFSITTGKDLGNITDIRIRHDNSGNKPGWFLGGVTIHKEDSNDDWSFPCNQWLAKDEDDHLIDRMIHAYDRTIPIP